MTISGEGREYCLANGFEARCGGTFGKNEVVKRNDPTVTKRCIILLQPMVSEDA